MRPALRLLASVKPVSGRYLEAGAPTGLTGLLTNPTPRATLLFLYSTTLEKLQAVPATSVYRQSVEAVTQQRLAAVQAVRPAGYDEWRRAALEILERHPDRFAADGVARLTADGSRAAGVERAGRFFVIHETKPAVDEREQEWDGEADTGGELEGHRTTEERQDQAQLLKNPFDGEGVEWVDEPKLTAEQVEELENKIGAGLIEEVIQVAEGELKLVDTMVQSKAWESLDEKPTEGQWKYFERKE